MAKTKNTYVVEFGSILALPDGREKRILAKKAVAGLLGFRTTETLSRQKVVATGEDAVFALRGMQKDTQGYKLSQGYEPTDPSDRTNTPVSLEEFCIQAEAIENDTAARLVAQLDQMMDAQEFEEAATLAVGGLGLLHGYNQTELYPYLEKLQDSYPLAKLYLGRAVLQGIYLNPDPELGVKLLLEASYDDDAIVSGYANLILGYHYRELEDGAKAVRHMEYAGMLGYENGAEMAGLMQQLGEFGIPVDNVRAARNYRHGAKAGCPRCSARLAVMVLNGDIAYTEGWRADFAAAIEGKATIAMSLRKAVETIDQEAAGRPEILVERFQEALSDFAQVSLTA